MYLFRDTQVTNIFLSLVTQLSVVYQGKNKKGQHQLSRKAVLEERGIKPRGNNGYGGGRRMDRDSRAAPTPAPEMSKEEVDVIAQAIENATTD